VAIFILTDRHKSSAVLLSYGSQDLLGLPGARFKVKPMWV